MSAYLHFPTVEESRGLRVAEHVYDLPDPIGLRAPSRLARALQRLGLGLLVTRRHGRLTGARLFRLEGRRA